VSFEFVFLYFNAMYGISFCAAVGCFTKYGQLCLTNSLSYKNNDEENYNVFIT